MQPHSTTCALGLTIEQLTVWQDNQLSATIHPKLSAHIPACAHCQGLLADLALITARLGTYRTPDLRARIWRGVQAGMVRSPRSMLVGRPLWSSVVGVLALITMVALFAQVLSLGNKLRPPITYHASPTARAVPVVTEGPLPPLPHIAGWQSSGPTFASSVAFTQSDPLTGYACGRAFLNGTSGMSALSVPQRSVTPGPNLPESDLPLGVTHDGGTTWQTITTSIRGIQCQVTVDPVNPLDILIRYDICTGNCSNYTYGIGHSPYLARSLDGGQSWAKLTLPSAPDVHTAILLRDVAWVGSTLFVSIDELPPYPAPAKKYLLKSVQGAALTLLANQVDAYGMIGLGNALYVSGYVTHDGGTTWTHQQFSHNNIGVDLVAGNADGSVLLGSYVMTDGPAPDGLPNHLPMLESRDGGVTWVVMPAPANGEFFEHWFSINTATIAPDGTILAICHIYTSSDYYSGFAMYSLAPGSQTWQKKAPILPDMLLSVSYDAQGHPARIWGHAGSNVDDFGNNVYFGLQYHAL